VEALAWPVKRFSEWVSEWYNTVYTWQICELHDTELHGSWSSFFSIPCRCHKWHQHRTFPFPATTERLRHIHTTVKHYDMFSQHSVFAECFLAVTATKFLLHYALTTRLLLVIRLSWGILPVVRKMKQMQKLSRPTLLRDSTWLVGATFAPGCPEPVVVEVQHVHDGSASLLQLLKEMQTWRCRRTTVSPWLVHLLLVSHMRSWFGVICVARWWRTATKWTSVASLLLAVDCTRLWRKRLHTDMYVCEVCSWTSYKSLLPPYSTVESRVDETLCFLSLISELGWVGSCWGSLDRVMATDAHSLSWSCWTDRF